jgi:mycoredoxin
MTMSAENETKTDHITVYATTWCGDCHRAKRVLDRHAAPYRWIDVDEDEEAAGEVLRINRGLRSVPTILFPDGTVLVEPSDAELEAKLAG